jgi:hypothetical protein
VATNATCGTISSTSGPWLQIYKSMLRWCLHNCTSYGGSIAATSAERLIYPNIRIGGKHEMLGYGQTIEQ